MPTDSIDQAHSCLARLRAEVDTSFSHLKGLCSEAGRLSPTLLDQHQKVSYELAFCVAELEACTAMLPLVVVRMPLLWERIHHQCHVVRSTKLFRQLFFCRRAAAS